MKITHIEPIGFVSAPRPHAEDDFWGGEEASITLTAPFTAEALAGLVTATFNFENWTLPSMFAHPSYLAGLGVMAAIAWILVKIPLGNAGDPNEPAPPAAIM